MISSAQLKAKKILNWLASASVFSFSVVSTSDMLTQIRNNIKRLQNAYNDKKTKTRLPRITLLFILAIFEIIEQNLSTVFGSMVCCTNLPLVIFPHQCSDESGSGTRFMLFKFDLL